MKGREIKRKRKKEREREEKEWERKRNHSALICIREVPVVRVVIN